MCVGTLQVLHYHLKEQGRQERNTWPWVAGIHVQAEGEKGYRSPPHCLLGWTVGCLGAPTGQDPHKSLFREGGVSRTSGFNQTNVAAV